VNEPAKNISSTTWPYGKVEIANIYINRSLKLKPDTFDARLRELNKRNTEDSKTEACKLSANGIAVMIAHVLPRLLREGPPPAVKEIVELKEIERLRLEALERQRLLEEEELELLLLALH
jgi:hypothetical protein